MQHPDYHWDLRAPSGPAKGTKDYRIELEQRALRRSAIAAIPEFYGTAAQITVSQFPSVTVVEIKTATGARVTVSHNCIRLKNPGSGAMVSNALLAHAMWGKAFAEGHNDFQREAVAYGKALGIEIVARGQNYFSDEDRQWIDRFASELTKSGVGPHHPCKHPSRSLIFVGTPRPV